MVDWESDWEFVKNFWWLDMCGRLTTKSAILSGVAERWEVRWMGVPTLTPLTLLTINHLRSTPLNCHFVSLPICHDKMSVTASPIITNRFCIVTLLFVFPKDKIEFYELLLSVLIQYPSYLNTVKSILATLHRKFLDTPLFYP